MKYTLAAIFAIASVGGLTVDTWSNVAAMGGGLDVRVYVATIAVLGALAGFFISVAFQHNKLAGLILVMGWALGVVFSIGASIDRISGAKTARVHASASLNARIQRLDKEIRDTRTEMADEAKTGRGPNYNKLKDELKVLREQRRQFGIVKDDDPGSTTIAFVTAGAIKAKDWRITHPVMGVLALTCIFNAMLLLAGTMFASARSQPKVINAKATEVHNPVVNALRQHGALSNRELARRAKISETKSSRIVKRLCEDGQAVSEQCGRQKVIKLVA